MIRALFSILAALLVAGAARAEPRYSSIVLDAATDQTLHASHADAHRDPASLTKLMTLYLLFEELESGRVGLGDTLRTSARAASMPPVDLGLREGDTIRVLDAVHALIVRSANDVSVVIAERLEGDEDAFAERMSRTARELGMTRTRFANASGLPHPDQKTTARDMARLALALRRDYPHYYNWFSVREFSWGERTFANHNRLLATLEGSDGIKTGYTDASGYNLAASATRGDRRVVAIVLGGATGPERDRHTATLIERAFVHLEEQAVGGVEPPRHKPVALLRPEDKPATRQRLRIVIDESATMASAAPPLRADLNQSQPLRADDGAALAARAAPSPREPQIKPLIQPANAGDGWAIQVGAFSSRAAAQTRLAEVRRAAGAMLSATRDRVAQADGASLWRARFVGFDQTGAERACARLRAQDVACFAVDPA